MENIIYFQSMFFLSYPCIYFLMLWIFLHFIIYFIKFSFKSVVLFLSVCFLCLSSSVMWIWTNNLNVLRFISFYLNFYFYIVFGYFQIRLRTHYEDPSITLDLVSCQFSFHYSFESLAQAECMLQNAAECLQPGGFFIGTMPDANEIMSVL